MTDPSPYDSYRSPLAERNASRRMLELWSPRWKFNLWRRIWLAVAEAQHKLGLPVSESQVSELRAVVDRPGGITDAEMRAAEKYEKELRHDVMAHVHALGDSCPGAKGVIHLGLTSQDVVCNADLITLHRAARLIRIKLARAVIDLDDFAQKWADLPTLGFTHYQPAQPVTVGRRAAHWASDLSIVHDRVAALGLTWHNGYSAPGVLELRRLRGATGTQAALVALAAPLDALDDEFDNALASSIIEGTEALRDPFTSRIESYSSAVETDRDLNGDAPFYFNRSSRIVGQTYPRVLDTFVLADLASTAAVLHKIATDVRLLCNRKEIDEPFEDKQIGSSAMPYKRNPMRCERICGLARFVMNMVGNAYDTAATQWLERTLDDSSNRRLSLPEAFLALDGALDLMHNVASGLVVHEATVRKNLMAELPFMASENILMACVKAGGDRQHYHELIRRHAQAAGLRVKQEGLENDLLERLRADPNFRSVARGGPLAADLDWDGVMDPMKYVGMSVEQTRRFSTGVADQLREQYASALHLLGDTAPRG